MNALNHSEANYLWNPRAMVTFPYPSFTSLSFEWLVSGEVGQESDLITCQPPAPTPRRARLALSCTCQSILALCIKAPSVSNPLQLFLRHSNHFKLP